MVPISIYLYIYLSIYLSIYIRSPKTQYSNAHISGTTGPNYFKLSQFWQNMSTTCWQSGVSIGVREPPFFSVWKCPKILYICVYIVSWLSLWFSTFGEILLRAFFFLLWSPLCPCQVIDKKSNMSVIFLKYRKVK